MTVTVTLPFTVKAKPRPKVARNGGVFYGDAGYIGWRKDVLAHCKKVLKSLTLPKVPLGVDIVIYEDSFKLTIYETKVDHVYIRSDIDNAMGAIFDSLQPQKKGEYGLIENDRLIRQVNCRIAGKDELP